MVGGNVTATIQTKTTIKNEIGESVELWTSVGNIRGWLDFQSGQNEVSQYNAKLQNTTHVFICDYQKLNVTSENSRFILNGNIYNVLMIDNPMEICDHLEIFLQYIGGGLGVE